MVKAAPELEDTTRKSLYSNQKAREFHGSRQGAPSVSGGLVGDAIRCYAGRIRAGTALKITRAPWYCHIDGFEQVPKGEPEHNSELLRVVFNPNKAEKHARARPHCLFRKKMGELGDKAEQLVEKEQFDLLGRYLHH